MTNNTQQLKLIRDVFEQSSDLILVCDSESRTIYANQKTMTMFGYQSLDPMLGLDAYAMRCPAVESAETFLEQDKRALSKKQTITLLDIHTYADDRPYVLLTNKSPIYGDNQQIVGILCHCREVTATAFQALSMEIANADQHYLKKSPSLNRSYDLIKTNEVLSKRELECLFFLIRGKTMAQISDILFLSKRTVENHIANIKSKLGLQKKSQLIEYGIANGYLNIIPNSLLRRNLSVELDYFSLK